MPTKGTDHYQLVFPHPKLWIPATSLNWSEDTFSMFVTCRHFSASRGVAKTGSGKTLAFLLPGFVKLRHCAVAGWVGVCRCGFTNDFEYWSVLTPSIESCRVEPTVRDVNAGTAGCNNLQRFYLDPSWSVDSFRTIVSLSSFWHRYLYLIIWYSTCIWLFDYLSFFISNLIWWIVGSLRVTYFLCASRANRKLKRAGEVDTKRGPGHPEDPQRVGEWADQSHWQHVTNVATWQAAQHRRTWHRHSKQQSWVLSWDGIQRLLINVNHKNSQIYKSMTPLSRTKRSEFHCISC